MAYISAQDVREIRNALKKAYPEVKFSVQKDNCSAVRVAILKGPINFSDLFREGSDTEKNRNISVNHYHLGQYGEFTDFFQNIVSIMKTAATNNQWFDKSDAMVDYFHTAYYMSLEIGKWDKPYEYTG